MLRNTILSEGYGSRFLINPTKIRNENNITNFNLIYNLMRNSYFNLISSGFEDYSSFCKETSLVVGSSFHWSLSPFLISNTSAMIEGTTVVIDPPTSPAVVLRFIIISPPIYFNIYKSIKSLYITLPILLQSILDTKLYILELISNLYRQLSSCLKSSGIILPGKMTARIAGQKIRRIKKAECEIMEMDLNKNKTSKLDKQLKKCFNKRNNNKYLITGMF